jgi:hypothetical protein
VCWSGAESWGQLFARRTYDGEGSYESGQRLAHKQRNVLAIGESSAGESTISKPHWVVHRLLAETVAVSLSVSGLILSRLTEMVIHSQHSNRTRKLMAGFLLTVAKLYGTYGQRVVIA